MSNKKNNRAKEQRLAERQRLEKKKMLLQMEKEIQQLEFDIHHSKTANLKVHALRGLKISLRAGQLIAPYVLTAAITFGGFAALGGMPFIKDDQKKKLEMKKELDSFGNIRYEQQYDSFDSSKGTISYVGKWNKQDDGFYSREIKTYATENIEEDIITKIVNDVDITSLEDVFGAPVSSKLQTQNNLTDEEIQTQPYLEAVMYSKFDDDFIIVKESTSDNIGESILWFVLTLLAELIPLFIRLEVSSFDFEYWVDRIKEKHPLVDTKELTKKLEIKMNNYNRLTR